MDANFNFNPITGAAILTHRHRYQVEEFRRTPAEWKFNPMTGARRRDEDIKSDPQGLKKDGILGAWFRSEETPPISNPQGFKLKITPFPPGGDEMDGRRESWWKLRALAAEEGLRKYLSDLSSSISEVASGEIPAPHQELRNLNVGEAMEEGAAPWMPAMAARAWTTPSTESTEMDATLAMEFARLLEQAVDERTPRSNGRFPREYENHPLYDIFMQAIDQAVNGKGGRHGGGTVPFGEQQWAEITKNHGRGFLTGQGVKKLNEASASGEYGEPYERELLGAMVYVAAAVLYTQEQAAKPVGGSDWD